MSDYKDEIKLAMADVRERNNPRPGRVIGEAGGGGVAPTPPRREEIERTMRQMQYDRSLSRKRGVDVEGESYAPYRVKMQKLRDELEALGDD